MSYLHNSLKVNGEDDADAGDDDDGQVRDDVPLEAEVLQRVVPAVFRDVGVRHGEPDPDPTDEAGRLDGLLSPNVAQYAPRVRLRLLRLRRRGVVDGVQVGGGRVGAVVFVRRSAAVQASRDRLRRSFNLRLRYSNVRTG